MMHGRGYFSGDWFMGHCLSGSGWDWLIGIGILIIIVVSIILIFSKNKGNHKYKNTSAVYNAIDSLKMKYAQGEITEEEYKQRKNVLEEK